MRGGVVCIFRLTVDDYHRYMYIDDGYQTQERKIKGVFIQLIQLLMMCIQYTKGKYKSIQYTSIKKFWQCYYDGGWRSFSRKN